MLVGGVGRDEDALDSDSEAGDAGGSIYHAEVSNR